VEWIGLVVLVAVLLAGLLAAIGPGIPGGSLARAIGERIICAVRLSNACGGERDVALDRT
jgi:F0F1-type ATP synthase membrane subunit c/vacuolar-type H+-ATPase subunit K